MTIQRDGFSIHFTPENPVMGKFADVDLHFTSGPLEGLKLHGFGITRHIGGDISVAFPSQLRGLDSAAERKLRLSILAAWHEFEQLSAADPSAARG